MKTREEYLAYHREYNKTHRTQRSATHRAWRARNREKSNDNSRAWQKRNPDRFHLYQASWRLLNGYKRKAHSLSRNIPLQPCEVCGDIKTDRHHDDYSQTLSVRFFCRKHHKQLHHKQLEAGAR